MLVSEHVFCQLTSDLSKLNGSSGRKQRIRAKQLVTSVIDIADNDGLLELEDVIGLLKQLSTLEADEEARYKCELLWNQ